jgi:uncharacterized protein (DUF1800 family)
MTLDRRSFFRLAALTASAASIASCRSNLRIGNGSRGNLQGVSALSAHDRAVLDRVCYGVSELEATRVAEIGLEGWIEEQLSLESLPEVDLRWRMRNLDVLSKDADAIRGVHKRHEAVEQLRKGTLLRQVYGRRQIYEMMVEFWTDHFNISIEKGSVWALKIVDDREVIRRHALGSFHDLLSGSAHSPAMLVYLDNQANDRNAPNENYARELLELHTLGVDGGYTQQDVIGMARCLTGWTIKQHFWPGQFQFKEQVHDYRSKVVLGMRIDPEGKLEVERVLDNLGKHPATARHLAVKILRRFVSDEPERLIPDWVGKLEQVFMLTRGTINAVLRKLFLDGLAKDQALLAPKVKRPVDFVVSALRIISANTDGGIALQRFLSRMGQPTFAWPTPDGPPDTAAHWNSNLVPRWEFSLQLMAGLIDGSETDITSSVWSLAEGSASEILQAACEHLLGYSLPEPVSAELLATYREIDGVSRRRAIEAIFSGLLASPGFQYR